MPSPALALYLFASRRATGLARAILGRRARRGKEDPDRMAERLGHPGLPRPEGPLVWLHAASVGEALSVLELLRQLQALRPDLTMLVTTGTRSSAQLMARRLPEGALHQYAPVDVLPAVERFLAHWRPGLAVWIENEVWPAMIHATRAAGVPLAMVNARMSERSARRWRRAPGMIRRLLSAFRLVFAQDEISAARLRSLGAEPVIVTGTLKEGAAPLKHEEAERRRIAERIAGRPLWLAASTHEGEEVLAAEAHRALRRAGLDALLILVPRHPERGPALADMLSAGSFRVARRGAGALPGPDTDIYVADTLGELGLWYRLSPLAFIGGSLVPVGGHNPFEPAALGSAIIHGPHVESFQDGYSRLKVAGAACEVASAEALATAVRRLMSPEVAAGMAAAAWALFSEGGNVTDRVVEALSPLLPPADGG
jgi:3-deoxy-D-manno-octulosonic-acid transferase